ncbi:hypothetical protein EEB18_017555 [Sphingopyxis sp. OPL5]|uniref:hypothetical protein n=1 Tax=Sphingopyxis sp. OPL5 TaxID=2486273 RepID=UPI00164DCD24|nr:hypothetical protein [Sphingopyxis sp. OPL5]QNO26534.1 hypothetical protein EEB18_017555 [Sphingopyxis sp. OPL5]
MLRDKQRAVIVAAILSVAASLSMLVSTFVAPEFPIWPIMACNWLLFMSVTWLVGHQVSLFGQCKGIGRVNRNIWRVVILAFSGCGFVAIANGATII